MNLLEQHAKELMSTPPAWARPRHGGRSRQFYLNARRNEPCHRKRASENLTCSRAYASGFQAPP